MRTSLRLVPGPCRVEAAVRHALALLGATSLLLAPTAGSWKLAGLAALLLAWRWAAEPRRQDRESGLLLYPDGTATLVQGAAVRPVVVTGRAWLSRPVCVIEVAEPEHGTHRWLRICAARQHADDYRRLRGLLRLGAFTDAEACLD